MRCYICNSDSDGITWDNLHEDFGPCHACQVIINEIKFADTIQENNEMLDTEVDDHVYC